mmetsp:Transcript_8352/g.21272  ORF Transcript_8352/g.21272 Transcript_8352/m.21272 type:complete len:820 (-) Transcript_8352:193-2652(-)
MPAMRVNVVWFKCTDLRTHDHAALKAAHAEGLPVIHLYVFDPFWHAGTTRLAGFPKTGAVRTRFQLESLADLAGSLASAGHALSTRTNISTAACFDELCNDYTVNAVFAFQEICSEELRIERSVREVLRRRGQIPLRLFWGFELYHRDDLPFDPSRARGPFNSYTAFRKRLEESCWIRPSGQESPTLRTGANASVRWPRSSSTLPSVKDVMGAAYDPAADPGEHKDARAELRWRGGETAALARVQEYLWDEDSLGLDYVGATMTMDPAKSCMRDKAMSKLSPWLAHGCLSPRRLYEEVKRYERERRKNKGTYWITHELLWRDFVRFGSIHAGTSIFKIGGHANLRPTWQWSTDKKLLHAWRKGLTGFPFIDCFMRELKATGYCNHMGRECAGWFLIGDLGIDWRLGAEWFESVLVDYEPTANWYNWSYRCLPAASRGGAHGFLLESPGHRLQGLEILKWGTQHDPDAQYIKRWIPELAPLPATVAREPWRLGLLDDARPTRSGQEGLRPMPTGRFDVNKEALQAVLAMGFSQSDAAMALYRTWEDPDAAVSLLLAGGGAEPTEDEDMARAIQLSLQANRPGGGDDSIIIDDSKDDERPEVNVDMKAVDEDDDDLSLALQMSLEAPTAHGVASPAPTARAQDSKPGFRYGVDYPKPVIQPVSIRDTEEAEAEARRAQAERDRQNAATRQRSARSGGSAGRFGKGAKKQWPHETPTAAGAQKGRESMRGERGQGASQEDDGAATRMSVDSDGIHPHDPPRSASGTYAGRGGKASGGYPPGGDLAAGRDGKGHGHRQHRADAERKRRWGAKERIEDDHLRGA